MTLEDLKRSVNESLATETIGTPVSARVHLQFHDAAIDLIDATSAIRHVFEPAFRTKPRHVSAQADPNQRQLTLLVEYEAGQTAMITVGRGNTENSKFSSSWSGTMG